MYIVSGCLLGDNCKYNGKNNFNLYVADFLKDKKYIKVCPEVAGGLPTPRIPAEIRENQVVNREGEDVTEQFVSGAEKSMAECIKSSELFSEKIQGAILKAKSPSCGKGQIYDGTFRGRLVIGNGVFAQMLIKSGITVFTESDIENIK